MSPEGRTPRLGASELAGGGGLGLGELATRQYGVVSTRQMQGLGVSERTVRGWASAGRLYRVHQGVYAVGHRHLTWHGWCMAAVLAAEPNAPGEIVWPAVASHESAAYLWGLLRYRPEAMHVTAPIRRRARRGFRVHFSSIIGAEDRAVREGIPLTSVARTFLDLALTWRPGALDGALERAEERGLFDLAEVESVLARAGGHRGRGPLRRALAVYRPDPAFTRSKFERRFRRLVAAAGLPPPAANIAVAGYELDAFWPELRFAVELDLFETHGTRAAFERDRRRDEELKLLGIEMIRVTEPRLKQDPGAVIANLSTLLERRRRELADAPP